MNWAIVLAGGVGSRFWPLSTPERPKQLLALAGGDPLLVESLRRLEGLIPPERTFIVTGAPLQETVREVAASVPSENVLAEPRAASTAPALAWATSLIAERDEDAVVLSLHADWAIHDADAFRQTAARALDLAAARDVLVTVGVPPSRTEPALGHIVPGDDLDGAQRVLRFVEKPPAAIAAELTERGALWNSGLFAWTAHRFAAEVREHATELAPGLPALEAGDVGAFFEQVTPVPVDTAVLERSDRVAVVRATFDWDDVGSWAALARVNATDAAGNFAHGPAALVDAEACVVWTDDAPVVLAGLRETVVVQANGVTLIASREAAADLKSLLDRLPPELGGSP